MGIPPVGAPKSWGKSVSPPFMGRQYFLRDAREESMKLMLAALALGALASEEDWIAIHRLIKPQAGESLWASIPWLTNLKEARERAAREDKPLFLWRAGGGDTLGR